jgi:hypothetical protein
MHRKSGATVAASRLLISRWSSLLLLFLPIAAFGLPDAPSADLVTSQGNCTVI